MAAVYSAVPQPAVTSPLIEHTNYFTQQFPSQHYTPPPSSDGAALNGSPTSPRTVWPMSAHLQYQRQLRPPKSPMYVPAVLRQTERPPRQSPPKHGHRTAYGSPESIVGELPGTRIGPQSNGPVAGLSRMVTEEWNEEMLGQVTGSPSRNHWKPDTATQTCEYPSCDKPFTFLQRRHHCRRCGNIFCQEHSGHSIPLDQHARFHPKGSRNRACDLCFNDYRAWRAARASRSNSSTSGDSTNVPPTPNVEMPSSGAVQAQDDSLRVGSLAQSIPRDWNWSTF